ncbi:complex 1 protein, LYR family protein [Medicago truncatula]|uniref:Complex 1 protein, LYR family protein n=1 Tax=Medicago truncatula TaxID=3880 RepID=G7KX71_MEDTR|nr:complex 1 protein, LYR family protein [Medicago truncatula]
MNNINIKSLLSIFLFSLLLFSSLFSSLPKPINTDLCRRNRKLTVLDLWWFKVASQTLLRVSRQFPDYNIRENTKQRVVDAFRSNPTLSEPSLLSKAFLFGKSQLDVAKQQAIVYSIYAPSLPSVTDLPNKPF